MFNSFLDNSLDLDKLSFGNSVTIILFVCFEGDISTIEFPIACFV